jgi:hypothetical protein
MQERRNQFSCAVICASMLVYLALSLVPTAVTATKTAMRINASITAYSTAVAASSLL